MKPRFETLDALLAHYDVGNMDLSEHEVRTQLCSLERMSTELAGGPSPELQHELLAFSYYEKRRNRENPDEEWFAPIFSSPVDKLGKTETSSNGLHEATIDYWRKRAFNSNHPFLRFRYSGLIWQFSQRASRKSAGVEIARCAIEAACQLALKGGCQFETDVINKLAKSVPLALRINDATVTERLVDTIIAFEARVARDKMLGLWGFSFDLLCDQNRVSLIPNTEARIVSDLDSRLDRLTKTRDARDINPLAIEAALLRLAKYYRRKGLADELSRVMLKGSQAIQRNSVVVSATIGAHQLHRMYLLLLRFGLKDDAERLNVALRQVSAACNGELLQTVHTIEVPHEEMDEFVGLFTQGSPSKSLDAIAGHFVPSVKETHDQVRQLAIQYPLSEIFGKTIIDNDGRPTAAFGSAESDPSSALIKHMSDCLVYAALFIRTVFTKVLQKEEVNPDVVMEYLFRSPLFEAGDRATWETGVRAFFAADWTTAIHILVPRIEKTLRQLVEWQGGSIQKPNRSGGFHLKTLDEVLRDDLIARVFGEDVPVYFQALFTDLRGWNIRNRVCHGLCADNLFSSTVADRVFHAVLVLAQVRHGSEVAPCEEINTPKESAVATNYVQK